MDLIQRIVIFIRTIKPPVKLMLIVVLLISTSHISKNVIPATDNILIAILYNIIVIFGGLLMLELLHEFNKEI